MQMHDQTLGSNLSGIFLLAGEDRGLRLWRKVFQSTELRPIWQATVKIVDIDAHMIGKL